MVCKFKFSFLLFLIMSLIVFIPLEISEIFGASSEPSGYPGGGLANPDLRPDTATNENIVNTCGIVPPAGPKDSLILSIVTLCLPGVLEKTMEWKEIKCEMAVCSYEAVKNNLDPAFCKKQGSYKTCKYIMGEVFAIPPLSILNYLRDLVAQIIANPVGILFAASTRYARIQITTLCAPGSQVCDVSKNPVLNYGVYLLIFVDTLSVYQTLTDIMENGFSSIFGSTDSKCDQLSEIREDVEGLVENG